MKHIAFIGVGNMAGAILQGITAESCPVRIPFEHITLFDISEEKLAPYRARGCKIAASAPDAVAASDTVVLSVKPQQYADVLGEINRSHVSLEGRTFISLAAGVDTKTIEDALGGGCAVVRTMPNTPLLIGEGMTALCRNKYVSDSAFTEITEMFASRGRVAVIDEENMNRIIAVSSSAIACFYRMIRALSTTVEESALPEIDEQVLRLSAAQAAVGAAKMVLEKEEFSLDELIRMVTSYKGTTEQMMLTMDNEDFDGMMARAMRACTKRADELGNDLKKAIASSNA